MMTSLTLELKKIRYMVLADFRVRMLFQFGLVLQIINIVMGAASYYFLTTVFRGESEVMGRYGTDVLSYILLGMTINPVLMTSFSGIFNALVMSYSSRALERIMMTPTSIYTLFFSQMAGGYITSVLSSILTLLVGITLFGVSLGKGNPLPALLFLLLGAISTIALGMLLAQIFFYTDTGKGGGGSVTVFAHTFVNAFTGATFPVEVLPGWLGWVSVLLPQTHAIRSARLTLAGHPWTDSTVLGDLSYLVGFCLLVLPVGIWLIRRGLEKIRQEGYAPQTSVMFFD
ncbi:MAG: ABC transporter permease [Acidobacteria bacterium]|nr:ABC transporter permease [Acidobacteriota bacterium]MCI0591586.1 ABC transporter permease [Gammaproteobacteria bacterium]